MNVISEKKVKTRKDHKCWGCTKVLPKGSTAQTTICVDGEKIGTTYWCEICSNFMNTLDSWDTQDGFCYGELKQDERYPIDKSYNIQNSPNQARTGVF